MAEPIKPDEVVEAARLVVNALQTVIGSEEAMRVLDTIVLDADPQAGWTLTIGDVVQSALKVWADASKGQQL